METKDFSKTVREHKMLTELIEAAGNYIIGYYNTAKENGLIKDFRTVVTFDDNKAAFIMMPSIQEEKKSIYDYSFQISIEFDEGKSLCRTGSYLAIEEGVFDTSIGRQDIISIIYFSLRGARERFEKVLNKKLAKYLSLDEKIKVDPFSINLWKDKCYCRPIEGIITEESINKARTTF